MTSDELFDAFRTDVSDDAEPYLWTDAEVWRYLNDAYLMFARLTGGIPDTLSFDLTAGEQFTEVSPKIVKFRDAFLDSTGRRLTIINPLNIPTTGGVDYGQARTLFLNKTPGLVTYMVIGDWRDRKTGVVSWVQIPAAADTVTCSVYRLPLKTITTGMEFDDIGEEHHEHLMSWMKHRAYGKQDAETFDRGRRDEYKAEFQDYCALSKAEWERYKHKTRVVSYGGI